MKDYNGETGRARKTCKFYKELDGTIGHRPASVPPAILDTGNSRSSNSVNEDSAMEKETNGIMMTFYGTSYKFGLVNRWW